MERFENIDWKIHKSYGQSYITPDEHGKWTKVLSDLRRSNSILPYERSAINSMLKLGLKHYYELKEYLYSEPRREAQKFIGHKDVRNYIFEKYGKICLCCGSTKRLSLDHIVPVHLNGKNTLENIQPLCKSCNSSKGTNIIDYR
jgi:hypothetical protein